MVIHTPPFRLLPSTPSRRKWSATVTTIVERLRMALELGPIHPAAEAFTYRLSQVHPEESSPRGWRCQAKHSER